MMTLNEKIERLVALENDNLELDKESYERFLTVMKAKADAGVAFTTSDECQERDHWHAIAKRKAKIETYHEVLTLMKREHGKH